MFISTLSFSGDTPKSSVVQYASNKAEECIEASQNPDISPEEQDLAQDDALLWRFLVLLCQQNGVVVPSDVSDLLMKEVSPPTVRSPRGVGVGGVDKEESDDTALNELRHLLIAGRKKVITTYMYM